MQKLRQFISLTRLPLAYSLQCYPKMASSSPSNLLPLRTLWNLLELPQSSSSLRSPYASRVINFRTFSSKVIDDAQTPAAIDYRYLLSILFSPFCILNVLGLIAELGLYFVLFKLNLRIGNLLNYNFRLKILKFVSSLKIVLEAELLL